MSRQYGLFCAVGRCEGCGLLMVKRRPHRVIRAHVDGCVRCGGSVSYRRSRWSEYVWLMRTGRARYVSILSHPDPD